MVKNYFRSRPCIFKLNRWYFIMQNLSIQYLQVIQWLTKLYRLNSPVFINHLLCLDFSASKIWESELRLLALLNHLKMLKKYSLFFYISRNYNLCGGFIGRIINFWMEALWFCEADLMVASLDHFVLPYSAVRCEIDRLDHWSALPPDGTMADV